VRNEFNKPIQQISKSKQLLKGVVICLFIGLGVVGRSAIWAQTGPLTEGANVSATVPDSFPPSAPTLISPADDSLLTNKSPPFVWKESTDNIGVTKYQLYIDGALKLDNIPTSTTVAGSYTLTYNSLNQEYTLSNTSFNLSDGSHTWNVVVFDAAGNSTSSVIWDFRIDTTAPNFVITYIDNTNTNINTSDPSSVPNEPVELQNNEPTFVGVGEANSTVVLKIDYESLGDEFYNFSINSDGVWSIALPILPRGETIYLTFTITDKAGLTSSITRVPILLPSLVVTPTVTPTPTPIIGTVTPDPDTGEITPTPSMSMIPTGPVPTPTEYNPFIPLDETGPLLIRRLQNLEFFSSESDSPYIKTLEASQTFETSSLATALPFLSLILIQLVGIAAHLSHTLSPRAIFEAGTIIEILRLLGLMPKEKPYGLVFETITQEPAQYATVIFLGTSEDGKPVKKIKITNKDGIYGKPSLPNGTYRVLIEFEKHLFPTMVQKESYVPWQNFYKGEEFIVKDGDEPSFFIPIDTNITVHDPELLHNMVRGAEQKVLTFNPFSNKVLMLNLILAFLFPSIFNTVFFLAQVAIFAFRVINSHQPTFTGKVVAEDDRPLEKAALKVLNKETHALEDIGQTSDSGEFAFNVSKGVHTVLVHLHEYKIQQTTENNPNLGEALLLSMGDQPVYETIVMKKNLHTYKPLRAS